MLPGMESFGFESRNVTATEGVIGGRRDPQNGVSLCCGTVNVFAICLFYITAQDQPCCVEIDRTSTDAQLHLSSQASQGFSNEFTNS